MPKHTPAEKRKNKETARRAKVAKIVKPKRKFGETTSRDQLTTLEGQDKPTPKPKPKPKPEPKPKTLTKEEIAKRKKKLESSFTRRTAKFFGFR